MIGAREAAGEHPVDEQLLPDFERIHLRGGHVHEGAGRADDQRGHAGDAGGDGVGEREAVERRDVGRAEILKGQNENCVLSSFFFRGLAEALGEHGEQASGSLFFFGCGGRQEDGAASPGIMPVSNCSVFMMVFSASRTSAALA